MLYEEVEKYSRTTTWILDAVSRLNHANEKGWGWGGGVELFWSNLSVEYVILHYVART